MIIITQDSGAIDMNEHHSFRDTSLRRGCFAGQGPLEMYHKYCPKNDSTLVNIWHEKVESKDKYKLRFSLRVMDIRFIFNVLPNLFGFEGLLLHSIRKS